MLHVHVGLTHPARSGCGRCTHPPPAAAAHSGLRPRQITPHIRNSCTLQPSPVSPMPGSTNAHEPSTQRQLLCSATPVEQPKAGPWPRPASPSLQSAVALRSLLSHGLLSLSHGRSPQGAEVPPHRVCTNMSTTKPWYPLRQTVRTRAQLPFHHGNPHAAGEMRSRR